ncbi:MAG TPA: methionyl-tRNA formyltransferase [Patescibacteria group bacterium]|nr:methionyl-tRNA formyltransferase [Patescibacteria group bacterium]
MSGPSAAGHESGPIRVVFLGSGTFAVPILEMLATSLEVALAGVVTAPARKAGRHGDLRPTPVAAAAAGFGAPVLTPERLRAPESIAAILALRPGLAVLADYGQIVPGPVLALPHGALNLHPSLLPRHRGATPIPATILADDRETGVTLMRMDEGLDTGPIVAADRWLLTGTETAPELEERAAGAAVRLLAASLGAWLRGELGAVPQDEAAATLTRPLRREDGRLDPGRPAVELARQVRAYQPWPGSFVEIGSERLVILAASVGPAGDDGRPGELVQDGRGLALATVDGRLLLDEIVPAGARPMRGAEYVRGRPAILGRIVGA